MGFKAKIAAIEFAGDDVVLTVVKTGGKLPKVIGLQVCRAEYADPGQRSEALVEAVKAAVNALKPRVAAYTLCVSGRHGIVRMLRIPFRGKRRVGAAVQFELEPYLAFPIDDLLVDHCHVYEAEGQTDVFAVGLRRELLEEQLAILHEAGIDPEGIGVDVEGLTHLWQAATPGRKKGLSAVLHAREEGAVVAIMNNKALAYFRCLTLTAETIRTSPLAAAREVQNSVRGFIANWRGGGEIASIAVTGAGLCGESRESFERELGMTVVDVDLMEKLKCTKAVRQAGDACAKRLREAGETPACLDETSVQEEETAGNSEPAAFSEETAGLAAPEEEPPEIALEYVDPLALAAPEEEPAVPAFEDADPLALAAPEEEPAETAGPCPSGAGNFWEAGIGVAACAGGGKRFLNFRKGDLAYNRLLVGALGDVMFASCLALVLLAVWAWQYYDGRAKNLAEIGHLRAEIETVQKEVEDLQEQGFDVPIEIFNAPSLLDILAEIGRKIPKEKASISFLKVDRPGTDAPWITLRGEVKDDAVFKAAVANLKKSAIMRVDDDPELVLDEGKSTFTLTAKSALAAAGEGAE